MAVGFVRHLCWIVVAAAVASLAACGGGGGGGGGTAAGAGGSGSSGGSGGGASGGGSGGSSGSNTVSSAQLGPNLGQALLGPIVDATVAVYEAEDFDGVPVCTGTTSAEDDPKGPGVIDLGSCAISAGSLYFIVVEGGWDIDADDDGVIDTARTAKAGSLRAIVSGQRILDGDFRVNLVTEIAFQSVSDAFLGGAEQFEVLSRLDAVAKQLLSTDLNGDGIVDNEDLLEFSPLDDQDSIAGNYGQLLEDILAAILSGDRNQLTRLSRELLLGSLGEYGFAELVSQQVQVENLRIADYLVAGGYVYAAGFDIGSPASDLKIFVFDVTDFSDVSLVGFYANENLTVNPQGTKLDLLKTDDVLYVASQGNGLFVVDVSEPAAPTATLLFDGSHFTHMTLGGESTMYVAYDDELSASVRGINIVDISDPTSPQIVGSASGVTVFDMVYASGSLFVYGPGVAIYDATSAASLTPLGSVSFPASSDTRVAYRDGFIYAPILDVDAGLQGMTIVDVRDTENPQRIDDLAGIGSITEVDINGATLYATASTNFGSSFVVMAFAIGDDGRLQMIDSRSSPIARFLRYDTGRVYLASRIQLTAYNANGLEKRVSHLGFLATGKSANLVQLAGSVAFVANDSDLLAIDISDPAAALPVLDRLDVTDWINDMQIIGDYAYLANSTAGIRIVDVSDPTNLQVVGSNDELVPFYMEEDDLTISREMTAIAVGDAYAYTLVGAYPNTSIGVFAIDDPAVPTVVYSPAFDRPVDDIALNGGTLYGVDRWFGSGSLHVIDVTDEPALTTSMDLSARAIDLEAGYLYTTSGSAGLSVLDVSDPSSPALFGEVLGLGIGNAVSVQGDTAYVANEFGAVEVYDVLDRTRPESLGQYPVSGTVKDVAATADYIFAVNGYGLVVEPAATAHAALE